MNMFMRTGKLLTRLAIIISLIGLATGIGRQLYQGRVAAQANTNCIITIDGNPGSTSNPIPVPPTVHNLALTVPAAFASQVQSVEFNLDGNAVKLGKAKQDTANNTTWTMPWYAQVTLKSGQHYITAASTGVTCTANPIPITMSTTTVVPLGVFVNPPNFTAHTNEAINFILKSTIGGATTGPDVSAYTLFEKLPQTLGSVSPQDSSSGFRFSAGPVAGTGVINVIAHYGGVDKAIAIPVNIMAQTATTTPTSNPNTGAPATNGSNAPGGQASPSSSTSAAISIEAEPAVKSCVTGKLSAERYQQISSGQGRPTTQEFEAFNDCFAGRNHVLPGGFVPVAADKVKDQAVSKDIKITNAVTETSRLKGSETTNIKFAGKSKPGSTVLIYIFSEPLVLSSKTDKNGDWSYSLEDPLEPGNHEAYAVIDRGDGTYSRSNVFGFAIAKVEASPANPNGYSLKIQSVQATANESNRTTNLYIVGVSVLILAVLGTMGFILIKKRKHAPAGVLISEPPTVTPEAGLPVTAASPVIAANPIPSSSAHIDPTADTLSSAVNPSTPNEEVIETGADKVPDPTTPDDASASSVPEVPEKPEINNSDQEVATIEPPADTTAPAERDTEQGR